MQRKFTDDQIRTMRFGHLVPKDVYTLNGRKVWKCECVSVNSRKRYNPGQYNSQVPRTTAR
jgi:hypothetical protein